MWYGDCAGVGVVSAGMGWKCVEPLVHGRGTCMMT